MPLYFFLIILFTLGLAFGSFASVIIHRLHTKEGGILWGRSKCPRCDKTLRAIDLIPILSYVARKFRCAFCKKPIAALYPILELSMGTLFALTGYHVLISPPVMVSQSVMVSLSNHDFSLLVFYLLVIFALVTISFYDILFREIPDEIALPAIAISLIAVPLLKIHPLTAALAGMALPLGFFGLLFFGSQGRWLGGGDLRLGALMGIVLGWPAILVGIFGAYVTGSIYSLIGIALKKIKPKGTIAFGPFLALGMVIALFWGEPIIEWYKGFLGMGY